MTEPIELDVTTLIIDLVRHKLTSPGLNLEPAIALMSQDPAVLVTLLHAAIDFAAAEITRVGDINEHLEYLDTHLTFGQITAGLDLNPGSEPPC